MDDIDQQYPRKGDRLSKPKTWWHHGSGMRPHELEDLCGSYRNAADCLAAQVTAGSVGAERFLAPIMFLYRHYLELRLKELNQTAHELLGKDAGLPGGHSLINLWAVARRFLDEVWPTGPRDQLQALDSVLREFDTLDPYSEAFRYPKDKKGRSISEDLPYLEIGQVSTVVGRAANLLDAASTGLNEYLSEKLEIEGEFRDEGDTE